MTTTTAAIRSAQPTINRDRAVRLLPVAGTTYVLAWLIGLFAAPSAPANDASADSIHRYFADHALAASVQALLVHGIAGLALVALTVGFARNLADNRLITVTGITAAAVSLTQFGFALAAAQNAQHTDASTTAAWFHAINYADTIKLMLLAALAATVTAAARTTISRWLRITGRVLVPLLVVGGLDFVAGNPVFGAALELSLIALLVWAGGTAWQLRRPTA